MSVRYIAAAAAVVLGGCAVGPRAVPVSLPYDRAAYDGYRAIGKNAVTGQAFMRQQGGGTVSCAGLPVLLFPDSPYFREVIQIVARGDTPDTSNARPGQDGSPVRADRCDAQGNFAITEVPPGRWILASDVVWRAGQSIQGGTLARGIEVVDGGENRFLLAGDDLQRPPR